MSIFQLIQAKTNGNDDLLLVIDGKVSSRWPYDTADPSLSNIGDLSDWDNQSAVGIDLSDYQSAFDSGEYEGLDILAEQTA